MGKIVWTGTVRDLYTYASKNKLNVTWERGKPVPGMSLKVEVIRVMHGSGDDENDDNGYDYITVEVYDKQGQFLGKVEQYHKPGF